MARNDQFNKVQVQVPKSNKFDLSHDYKTSLDMGNLIPFMMEEALPGDVFKMSASNLVRFLPLATPFMGRVKVFTSYFFVPNRIIYPEWEGFITGGQDPANAPNLPYTPPFTNLSGSLADYLGLPLGGLGSNSGGTMISALPFAAYTRCWYDYYRDQNLQDIPWEVVNEGANGTGFENFHMQLRKRAWGRDYLTSALPFAQKGDPVAIPVQTNIKGHAPVEVTGDTHHMMIHKADGTTATPGSPLTVGLGGQFQNQLAELLVLDPNGRLYIDGSYLDANDITTTINDLRTAEALQRWLEKNARAGSRYIEVLRAHFGAAPTDERLQRAEYIGSSVGDVVVSEVLQQSQPSDPMMNTPLATMGGHAISTNKGKMHLYTAQEHGYVVGLISILPDSSYSEGIDRKWSRMNRLDYAWPEFAHLGEQAVLGKEVYASTKLTPADRKASNEETFGYMPRYSEYTFANSLTTGKLRPTQSLGNWTLTRQFDRSVTPLLNESFIVANPSKRIMAVTAPSEPAIITHIYNNVKVWRKLPRYGTPMLV